MSFSALLLWLFFAEVGFGRFGCSEDGTLPLLGWADIVCFTFKKKSCVIKENLMASVLEEGYNLLYFELAGAHAGSLLFWCQSYAGGEKPACGHREDWWLLYIRPAQAPACQLQAHRSLKDPDYRFICSSSSAEGHLFKWSGPSIDMLSKQHRLLHLNQTLVLPAVQWMSV